MSPAGDCHPRRAPLGVTLLAGWWTPGTAAVAERALAARPGRLAVVQAGPDPVDGSDAWSSTPVEEELVHCSDDGCPCCAIRLDLAVAVTDLARRRERPDQVIVRLGPTADVAAALQTFLRHPDLRASTEVRSVITVLNVADLAPLVSRSGDLQARPEVHEPLVMADRVVLASDRPLTEQARDSFNWTVHALNRRAHLSDGREARLGDRVVDEAGASIAGIEADRRPLDPPTPPAEAPGLVRLVVDGVLDRDALSVWMDDLHHRSGGDLLRLDGVLAVDEEPCRWVARGVRTTLDLDDGAPWQPGETRSSRLWLVGRGLDSEGLRESLVRCAVVGR